MPWRQPSKPETPSFPNPLTNASERLRAVVEHRPPGVVLETGERLARPAAIKQDVADHALLAGDGVQRQEADSRQLVSGYVAVGTAEQLVAPADSEERRALRHGLVQPVGLGGEIVRDQSLLAILAAADVEEVDLADRHRVAHPDRTHVQLVAAQGGALREDGDVAAVGVNVQVVRIEMPDGDPHAALAQ